MKRSIKSSAENSCDDDYDGCTSLKYRKRSAVYKVVQNSVRRRFLCSDECYGFNTLLHLSRAVVKNKTVTNRLKRLFYTDESGTSSDEVEQGSATRGAKRSLADEEQRDVKRTKRDITFTAQGRG